MKLILSAIVTLLTYASVAIAQTAVCQSTNTCDGALVCTPFEAKLEVIALPDGTATLKWDDGPVFEGTSQTIDGMMVVASNNADTSAFQFALGASGQAIYSTATDFGEYIIAGFYTLNCTR